MTQWDVMGFSPQSKTRSYNFVKAINFTLPWEAGRDKEGNLRDDTISDTGGSTKYGISSRANPDVDVPNLTLEDAIAIYKKKYWDWYTVAQPQAWAVNLDAAEIGLAVSVFDCGVNQGVFQAQTWLLKALKDKIEDPAQYVNTMRGQKYATLKADPKYSGYYNGWMNRLNDLKKLVDVLRQEPAGFAQLPSA